MADEKKIAVIESESKEQAGECCVPECGPTTCEPATEVVAVPVVETQSAAEPKPTSSGCGCGPSSCA